MLRPAVIIPLAAAAFGLFWFLMSYFGHLPSAG
jgi:hypothetical protein